MRSPALRRGTARSFVDNKDWNKINKELEKELEKTDKDEGVNSMFQQLYANATDDQRRAMNKSFIESGGTCLSMNWDEVGSKKMEGTAPEGAVMKKWGED